VGFVFEMVRLGIANISLHLLRSVLTALGIIFGVAAVITMVAIGEGSKREALLQLEQLGAKNIIVRSEPPPESAQARGGTQRSFIQSFGMTRDTVNIVRTALPDDAGMVPLKAVGGQLLKEDRRMTSQAFGTTPELIVAANLRLERGRYLTQRDLEDQAMICVLGTEVARRLLPLTDPVGQTIRIDDKTLTVVGVLAPVGLAGGAGSALVGRDLNLDVHLPITTAGAVFGDVVVRRQSGSTQATRVEISELYITAPERDVVSLYAALATRALQVKHPGLSDVVVIVPYELLENARRSSLTWQIVLGFIAGISLLVGGIGIMNIMLASVTERIREIGIRRALGATRRNIIGQFIIETGVLSVVGGLVGVGLGVGVSVALSTLVPLLHKLPGLGQFFSAEAALATQVTGWSMIMAFLVATGTGLTFGIYPAIRAAAQDPIVALRHD